MRWLFLMVLSLNLAYIAWQTSMTGEDPYVHVQPLKDVKPIVLLSELKSQPVTSGESVMQAEKTVEQNGAEQQLVTEKTAEAEKAEPVESVPKEAVSEKMPAFVVADSEKAEAESEPERTESASSSESVIAETSCYTLGPFRDLDKLRSFTREIKSYVVEADFRGREEKDQTLYWVYLQPEKNRSSAIATGKRLKAKKIKDFYVIREGEKNNGISLGHFRNKDGAYGLFNKVKKLGFDVRIEPVYKYHTVYWLDYQLANGVNLPESIYAKYINSTNKGKISRLSRDCGV